MGNATSEAAGDREPRKIEIWDRCDKTANGPRFRHSEMVLVSDAGTRYSTRTTGDG